MTLAEPPSETTHWTGRAMARAAGVKLIQGVRFTDGIEVTTKPVSSQFQTAAA